MSKKKKHHKKKPDNRLYHIADSDVLINILVPDNESLRIKCKDYLENYGRLYRGAITVVTLGEVAKKICSVKDAQVRNAIFILLGKLITEQKIAILQINEKDAEKALEFHQADYKPHIPELLSLARAVREKANVFMTADKRLYDSAIRTYVKDKHGILIQMIS
ncbi:MAG: PIN domain-containing protein [Candidatus Aenigmarchaeota archaeon]|nr:PIN domain-containing protein [Candidatus Omnitrophota bacterium]MBI4170233.1 PIN domain-containing protein [Candidatus Aenigmarchaeota archaeon]